jgi:hypothetical protein
LARKPKSLALIKGCRNEWFYCGFSIVNFEKLYLMTLAIDAETILLK